MIWRKNKPSPQEQKRYTAYLESVAPTQEQLQKQREKIFSQNPFFSVICPGTEKEQALIEDTLNTLKAQTYSGWEFIAFSDVSLEMPVSEKINIGISDELYLKTTAFDNEKNITQIHNSVNVYARFKFL